MGSSHGEVRGTTMSRSAALAGVSGSVVTRVTRASRARTSERLDRSFPCPDRSPPRRPREAGVDERDGPVLHLARRVALGVDIRKLLELERALQATGS